MKKVLLPVLLSSMLIACSGTGDKAPTSSAGAGAGTASAGVSDAGVSRVKIGALGSGVDPATAGRTGGVAALTDPNHILSDRTVYFDFDSFVIKSEFAPLVEAHAAFLKANGQMRMMVQGNTDERGSREYNLALGQKRSEAVKRALVLLGVNEAQVESVSLGEEKPRCTDQAESCWGENRRSDILYSGEY